MTGHWLMPWHPRPDDRPVLLCLPPAGAGCGQFRPWQDALGLEVAVVGVQLPGREERFADPPAETVADAVRAMVAEIVTMVPAATPLLVYGHSFGGLLGYEVTRSLGALGRWPAALVVGACRPPHLWIGAGRGLVQDADELLRLLDARGLEYLDEDSRELMLEVLRQDARLSLTYVAPQRAVVACAVESWGGELDQTVTLSHVDGWRKYTAGSFRRRQFSGGHYFCVEQVDSVLFALRELVDGVAATPVTGRWRR
jgi:surfactin synthase thioesterase subunit